MTYGKGHTIYFLGIGGIGMSALARYFKHHGVAVSGYDRTPTRLTESLINEGIPVHYTDNVENIPPQVDLAIFTPAVPSDLKELALIREKGIQLMKRAEVLEMITAHIPTIAIAGTHGKTTITSMVAHILNEAGLPITAFIGGIANNFQSNLLLSDHSQWMVVEADEFDKSFLMLQPEIALISSMDADHLDIYGSHLQMQQQYNLFAARIKNKGILVHKKGLPVAVDRKTLTYSITEEASVSAKNIQVIDGTFQFELLIGGIPAEKVIMHVPGRHNIENALAATAIALQVGVSQGVIAQALASFKGVWRRFDVRLKTAFHTYIDDYAHHPEELKACIHTTRELYPEAHLVGIFQPHLYSRTRDFMNEFAISLSALDTLILLEIYPAREKPINGVDSAALLDLCSNTIKIVASKAEALDFVQSNRPNVLLTMGAGDIDQLIEPLQKMISSW